MNTVADWFDLHLDDLDAKGWNKPMTHEEFDAFMGMREGATRERYEREAWAKSLTLCTE